MITERGVCRGGGISQAAKAARSHPELNKISRMDAFTKQKSKHPLISSFQVKSQKHLVIFLSFYLQREFSKGSGPFWKNVSPLCPTEAPHPFYPFPYPAHAAALFVAMASFCQRIAHEDVAIATDVRGPSLNYKAP